MNLSRLLTIIGFAIVCSWSQQAVASGLPFTNQDLLGEWESVGCNNFSLGESQPPVNLKRHYAWSETNFVVRYSFFGDRQCQEPLYSFVSTGPYELSRVRPELKNTREATVFIESMFFGRCSFA